MRRNEKPKLDIENLSSILRLTDHWGVGGFSRKKFDVSIKPWDMSKIKPVLQFYSKIGGELVEPFTLNYEEPIGFGWKASVPAKFFEVGKLIFVAHGFLASHTIQWMEDMTKALLDKEVNCTIVRVGWSDGAGIVVSERTILLDIQKMLLLPSLTIVLIGIMLRSYSQASANCIAVGKLLGDIINGIKNKFKDMRIHCIGHSLGAHLMGFAGKVYHLHQQKAGKAGKIDRITGLDPAGPGFQNAGDSERLNKCDAKFVDVIHTDGLGDVYYFGTLLPMGDIDFYPNYGHHQCQIPVSIFVPILVPILAPINIYSASADLLKSHSLAVNYFIDSIKNAEAFRTKYELLERPDVEKIGKRTQELSNWIYMGYNSESSIGNVSSSGTKCFYLIL